MARRSRLSAAEKAEVVPKFLRREDSAVRLARVYGIGEQSVYRYRDEFLAAGKAGLAGNVDEKRRIQELERAVAEREQIIGELTIVNRVLKRRSEGSS